MDYQKQQERAAQFRQLHYDAPLLVLPNVWDAASARIIEQAGFPAIATTSSGVATVLGYSDGQHISRGMLIEALARITRVVDCPVTADIEAGYGDSIEEVLQTVKAVIETGVVGINIEDSLKQQENTLADITYQVELIQALRELANSLGVPFVINARVDVFLLAIGEPESRFEHAVQRANAYLQAGADCVYPIGFLERSTITDLVRAINGPINILGSSPDLPLPVLAQLGVARVSLASRLMLSILGHMRTIARELLEHGTYTSLHAEALSSTEFKALFS
ncbi:isocitrate lyase/PEP mutase family protein [Ktedonobacter racemifer]|uniref:PEP phosphonomutase and related enzymes-like protein n=1 Tax=Ktedonobacter racemifer DSM 44963 TaxID=485913 RepID=D6TZ64_KTERA|nr:isocitrate lyase/phosphoenolpyruvate mutase family protein [Ktedonobacter racemifer]EFH81854.1 PEP phosphonomutase and related enzymes-like protein [Ktedonobacter racemifer DSM 44963]